MNIKYGEFRQELLRVIIDYVIDDMGEDDRLSSECRTFLDRQWEGNAAPALPEDEFEDKTIRELRDRITIDAANFCDGWDACMREKINTP